MKKATVLCRIIPMLIWLLPAHARVIDASLGVSAARDGQVSYLVVFDERADLGAATSMTDWDKRGAYVVRQLQRTAARSQAGAGRLLDGARSRRAVSVVRPFFVINAMAVTSDYATLQALARLPGVERVRPLPQFELPRWQAKHDVDRRRAIEPNLLQIGVDQVWQQLGVDGTGVVVASIDSGVTYDHPALVDSYRGYDGAGFDHDYAFYDPTGVCAGEPCDNIDHGTHVMGITLGDDGAGMQVGVAPGARWIAAKGCESNTCSSIDLLLSAEWMLAPCPFGVAPGDPSCDAAMRPHIVNNSWGDPAGYNPFFEVVIEAWRAAGILPVFSAGNEGPAPATVGSPGDYCDVLGIASVNGADQVAQSSSRGPGSLPACVDKPDLSAPGVGIVSSVADGTYGVYSGTSMAAPHVTGCAALMQSVSPGLPYEETKAFLSDTAIDLGAPGADHDYGRGRIDCLAAVTLASTPDFRVRFSQPELPACAGATLSTDLSVIAIAGYDMPVTLSAQQGNFAANPVTPPAVTTYELSLAGFAAGVAQVVADGTGGPLTRSGALDLVVADTTPGVASALQPADGEHNVSVRPAFGWVAGAQSYRWSVVLARDAALSDVVATAIDLAEPQWAPLLQLEPETQYYWQVTARNGCGQTASPVQAIRTRYAPVLLVEDSGGTGWAESAVYDEVLADLDVEYLFWDTGISDTDEPDAAALARHDFVLWYSGTGWSDTVGPGVAAEAALTGFLNDGGCLVMSAQTYSFWKDATPWLTSTFGATSDGDPALFSAFRRTYPQAGPELPFSSPSNYLVNLSRRLEILPGAMEFFEGSQSPLGPGPAASLKIAGTPPDESVAVWTAFVLAALPQPALTETLSDLFELCGVVSFAADTDGDGVADDSDNCIDVSNPDQRDADADGHGSLCDADFNNDCGINFADLSAMKLGFFGSDPILDVDGSGVVNFVDLNLMKGMFFGAPGPSAAGLCP